MPGIITSIGSNNNHAIYGDIQGPMVAMLELEYGRYANDERFNLWKKVFPEFKLETQNASIVGLGGGGLFEDVGENGEYPVGNAIEEGFKKTLEAEEWKYAISISQTMMEDKLDFLLKDQPKKLNDSYFRTRNAFFWGLLAAALSNTDYVTPMKKRISIKTSDGVNVFSNSHKYAHKSGSYSNACSDALSVTSIGTVAEKMQNRLDDNGEIIGMAPDLLIIPNTDKAKSDVFGILGAYHDPGTAAGNKFNYQFDNWTVLCSPWLAHLQSVSGTTVSYPWIMMDSAYNEMNYGARAIERIPLTVTSEIMSNDANLWKGRSRFSGAFIDPRAFFAGGVSFGSAL